MLCGCICCVVHFCIIPCSLWCASLLCPMHCSDKMIYEAAIALSQSLTSEERQRGQIFPSVNRIREVSKQVACAVILQAVEEGQVHETTLDRMPRLSTPGALSAYVHRKMYDPVYVPIV
eukprot:m.696257 g.696257  ORF g.696257 m.696257 type:complete len:119 (+) comp22892_c1_seq11:177-533(+)